MVWRAKSGRILQSLLPAENHASDIIIGTHNGEMRGKGRITDLLAAQNVARYSGDNADTITIGADVFKLHLIPSIVLRKRRLSDWKRRCVPAVVLRGWMPLTASVLMSVRPG